LGESSTASEPVVALQYAAGNVLHPHRHDDPYISVLVHGSYTELCAASPRRCRAGTVIAHRADEEHADYFSSDAVCINIYGIEADRSSGCKRAIAAALAARGPCDWREALATVERALGAVRDDAFSLPAPPVWLERLLRDFSWTGNVPLKAAADSARVHPAHLTRAFRKYLGTTPGAYRRQSRVDAASARLLTSSASLAQIAAETGFYDQSDFTNRFFEASGLPPGRFRSIFRR
jgi:AraC family transcriptional regulator